jgi:predicted transcriptional regulator
MATAGALEAAIRKAVINDGILPAGGRRITAEEAAALGYANPAEAAGHDPAALLGLGQSDVALVLRRLATLPRQSDLMAGAPPFGLAVCDGSGALIFRRRLTAFSIPRFGAGCPLWPLYRALGRPGQPEAALIEMPQGARFRAWAVSQPAAPTGFGEAPVMQAVMLVTPAAGDAKGDAIAAGPGCHLCPRMGCPARR